MRAVALLITAALLASPVFPQSVEFTDVAADLGIEHTDTGNFYGAGLSFRDFDGDGWDDLSLTSGANETLAIYLNGEATSFVHASLALPGLQVSESEVVLWADYDNDGDQDLFVGYKAIPNQLFRNDGGVFTDVTAAAGLPTEEPAPLHRTSTAAWGDYNNDGALDLFIGNYGEGWDKNDLFRNNGDGTFTEVADLAGVGEARLPFAVVWADYDEDGWQDLYVGNDRDRGNQLFHNNADGTFDDVSRESGAGIVMGAMGIAVGDYDGDLDIDFYVSNTPVGNVLLRNNSDGTFTEVAEEAGVSVNQLCWGVNFFDADNAGDLDLFVASGGWSEGSLENILFANLGDGTFRRYLVFEGYAYSSFGTAIGDFDRNGYPDIAILNTDDPFTLWRNSGGPNHWLRIDLEGTTSNRDAIGSRVEVYAGGQAYVRTTHAGLSYKSQHSHTLTVGVGLATLVDSLAILWPGGSREVHYNLGIDRIHHFTEGVVTSTSPEIPGQTNITLEPAFPNPFSAATSLRWSGALGVNQILAVYDVMGRRVHTVALPRGKMSGEITWDGRDSQGRLLPSGIYFFRLEGVTEAKARSVVLLR